ncbi:MAG TPA: SIMPL domain-containing protein [Pyrinomonadaceae bacterium]|nr:SIMPL domain-containing protein [Pyrinomonadaceae bacterium]
MKKCVLLVLSLFAVVPASGQESGNRIYGNNGYYQQQNRHLQIGTGSLGPSDSYAIEANVLINLKPDAYVAVFGVNDEGANSATSNQKVNAKVADLIERIKPLGIEANDVFVDFITQSRVYDFTVNGNQATENFSGFETKKTVAVRYKNRALFEKIVSAAADSQIFDLIKVDYVVSDFESVRARLFEAAVKVIKSKEQKYVNSLGVSLGAIGLSVEKYDVSYPAEAYQRYQAFETGDAYVYNNKGTSSRVTQRKSFTFFYDPFEASNFDAVLDRLGLEPAVQFSIYLRMQYQVRRSMLN